MSNRKCNKCGFFDGIACEAGVKSTYGGCDYHYETLIKMKQEQCKKNPCGKGRWYIKNGNYLLFYCSECDAESIRKTPYCPMCGAKKENIH